MLVAGQPVSVLGVALVGVFVGFVAGMFGIGGGFLLTPLLSVIFRIPLPVAVGSGLCQMVGTSTASFLRHRRLRQGEYRVDILMLAGSVAGVYAGARVLGALGAAGTVHVLGGEVPAVTLVLDLLYVVFLVGTATIFWAQGKASQETLAYVRSGPLARIRWGPSVDLPAVPLFRVSPLVIAYLGLALGFLSGLLGIGGGVALLPVLLYGFGFPIRQAAGTGILVIVVTASFGTFEHAMLGNVNLGLAMVLLVGGSVSAQVGALATHRLPARTLRRSLALLLVVTAVVVAWDLARRFAV